MPRHRIRAMYNWLTENLDINSDLLSHLYGARVLAQSEFEKLSAKELNPMKIHWFLSKIGEKSRADFAIFEQILRKTNQVHVSEKLSEPICEFYDLQI